jgi:hypothetical protein
MLVVDVDATHVIAHSEKVGAGGTYKGQFGFIRCWGGRGRVRWSV